MYHDPRSRRRAFTLVELLVVITIIGILIALLLPAVQAAREAARRASCTNNLKELMLATLNYESAYKMFPINYGGNGAFDTTMTGHSWITGVLPFMEQQALYDIIDTRYALSYTNTSNNIDNPRASETVLAALMCASDSRRGTLPNRYSGVEERAITNYKSVAGGNWGTEGGTTPDGGSTIDCTYPSTPISQSTGLNSGSSNGFEYGNGFICRNKDNNLANYHGMFEVRDGSSNTLGIGEAVPSWCDRTWWYSFDGATATCGIPLNYQKNEGVAWLEEHDDEYENNYSFFSQHPGGGNFALIDGSVRFVTDTVDVTIYRQMATISGKEPVSLP